MIATEAVVLNEDEARLLARIIADWLNDGFSVDEAVLTSAEVVLRRCEEWVKA